MLDVSMYKVVDATDEQLKDLGERAYIGTYHFVKKDKQRLADIPINIFNYLLSVGLVVKR